MQAFAPQGGANYGAPGTYSHDRGWKCAARDHQGSRSGPQLGRGPGRGPKKSAPPGWEAREVMKPSLGENPLGRTLRSRSRLPGPHRRERCPRGRLPKRTPRSGPPGRDGRRSRHRSRTGRHRRARGWRCTPLRRSSPRPRKRARRGRRRRSTRGPEISRVSSTPRVGPQPSKSVKSVSSKVARRRPAENSPSQLPSWKPSKISRSSAVISG